MSGGYKGVRLTDRENHFQDIYFLSGNVIRVDHSPNVEVVNNVVVGEAAAGLLEKLLSSGIPAGVAVVPIADTQRDGIVLLTESTVADKLQGHACWRFEVAAERPAGATYDIEFEDDLTSGRVRPRKRRRQ